MGAAYPELVRAQPLIEATLKQEETRFRQTLDKGLRLLDEATGSMKPGDTLAGETAFKLYDTYGFPYDLTEDALRAQGYGVDRAGFDAAMAEQKRAARAAWKGSGAKASDDLWFDIAEEAGGTEFIGYTAEEGRGAPWSRSSATAPAPSGGDRATTSWSSPTRRPSTRNPAARSAIPARSATTMGLRAVVADTSKQLGRLHVHHARIESGEIALGDPIKLRIDNARRSAIRANHSATLSCTRRCASGSASMLPRRAPLSPPIASASTSRTRARWGRPSSPGRGRRQRPGPRQHAGLDPPDDAGRSDRRGRDGPIRREIWRRGPRRFDGHRRRPLFGRAVRRHPRLRARRHWPLQGGGESAVSSGVRRVEALTGDAARAYLNARDEKLRAVAAALKTSPDEVPGRVTALMEERRRLERELPRRRRRWRWAAAGPRMRPARNRSPAPASSAR
jgi:alanyl-tRNA synthetase